MEILAQLNHRHMIGTFFIDRNPESVDEINQWLVDLVDKIKMKILMGPLSIYCNTVGNSGITGCVVIETSHCSVHFWANIENPFVKLDIYSCEDFDPAVIIEHLSIFQPNKYEYVILDRNNATKIIGQGKFNWD